MCCVDALRRARPSWAATVSAGFTHSCTVSDAKTVRCWGTLSSQELSPSIAQDVRAGRDFSCALLGYHYVSCWGNNDFNQLGSPVPDGRGAMVARRLENASQIAVGARHC